MTSRYEATIGSVNPVKLSSIDKNLLILDIAYSGMEKEEQDYKVENLDGYDIANTKNVKQTVTITFELHIYDIAKRNKACQKVNEWANSSNVLKTNDREDQFLMVHCEKQAVIESVRDWTKPLTLVFVSDYVPYWQTVKQTTLSLTGSKPSGTLKLDGNVGNALVSVTATANASITSFKVTVGSTNIELKNISVPSGKAIVIDYLRYRYLRVKANGASAMAKMQSGSTDLLLAPCGANTSVSIAANGKVTATVTARGMWL